MSSFDPHGTTIVCVRRDGNVAMGGDGQVTLGNTVMKGNARKVRRLHEGRVLAGFAGGTADAFTLFERFEAKLQQYGNLQRAAIELAKDWRTDRSLRRLEALLCVADRDALAHHLRQRRRDRARGRPDGHRLRRRLRAGRRERAARATPTLDARSIVEAALGHRRRHLHLHQPQHRRSRCSV